MTAPHWSLGVVSPLEMNGFFQTRRDDVVAEGASDKLLSINVFCKKDLMKVSNILPIKSAFFRSRHHQPLSYVH